MRIFGIDFTSAPRRNKPIKCAVGECENAELHIHEIESWEDFARFEALLNSSGPWTAAVDFPLGQPRQLVEALAWPDDWQRYVAQVGEMTRNQFVETIDRYRENQPAGEKHHFRCTDKMAGACSPMMVYGIPVGRMFFEGAPRVQRSGVSVIPHRPNGDDRKVIEGYPALVARCLIGRQPYKGENGDQATKHQTRYELIDSLNSSTLYKAYHVRPHLPDELLAELLEDRQGDAIDAVLCAIQAAAFLNAAVEGMAFPEDVDLLEGWIVDPTYW